MAFVVFWWWSERMDKVFVLSLGIAACERSKKATHPGGVPLVPIATALGYGDGWPRRPAGQGAVDSGSDRCMFSCETR